MNVVFRVDSSAQMGLGHLMRCLALAYELEQKGHNITFICRELEGNFIKMIVYKVIVLSINNSFRSEDLYLDWLGAEQEEDAEQTIRVLPNHTKYLIVDSYSLDRRWHQKLRPYVEKILVIDDLADRQFDCDLLLNQNLMVQKKDYKDIVPSSCKLLLGCDYALLRPEFQNLREKALKKRKLTKKVKNILISFGGSDVDNLTYDILKKINKDFNIVVILGLSSPHNKMVQKYAQDKNIEVIINTDNMSDLMLDADLAIGSSGSTSWERCCLGLPALLFIVGADQEKISYNLDVLGAAKVVKDLEVDLNNISSNITLWKDMSSKAANICDGSGSSKVAKLCLL